MSSNRRGRFPSSTNSPAIHDEDSEALASDILDKMDRSYTQDMRDQFLDRWIEYQFKTGCEISISEYLVMLIQANDD